MPLRNAKTISGDGEARLTEWFCKRKHVNGGPNWSLGSANHSLYYHKSDKNVRLRRIVYEKDANLSDLLFADRHCRVDLWVLQLAAT